MDESTKRAQVELKNILLWQDTHKFTFKAFYVLVPRLYRAQFRLQAQIL
jgi:hypothetical protein